MASTFAVGSLIAARGREWVVLPDSTDEAITARPLGGGQDDIACMLTGIDDIRAATFAPPSADDLGDQVSAGLLRTALRIGFRSGAGPFRSLASLAVEPRQYQLVPLLMALRQDVVRLLIADDVGIGKTVEAGLIAAELLATGQARGLAVLCSPALAEQWQGELRSKFGLDAELVLPSTVTRLQRGLMLGESLFERYPLVVVSTDFIKRPSYRDEFVRSCPDLVIVDEAHTCVSDASGERGSSSRTQRHELLLRLAATPDRHMVLVTATPHSGKDEGFRNLLGLLDPDLSDLDLSKEPNRQRLARHFVQRRRKDIRVFLDESTPFPIDRETREAPYKLSPDHARLFDRVLAHARQSVKAGTLAGGVQQRVTWWSALALLRAMASSPAAAAATLRTRAANLTSTTLEEADDLGRETVLDLGGDEPLESVDSTTGADTEDESAGSTAARRALQDLAEEAERLAPKDDAKLVEVTKVVKRLLADGFTPIVFCRFITTAHYVADHLDAVLGKGITVQAVTGELPPSERMDRIAELATTGRPVLIATDCLSEGVNLQDTFSAVVHYDLAWNPTRHEQREGRVDRFGQTKDVVRAVTIYGRDNHVDGIVLDVLLRKHEAIRKATGVSVPVPSSCNSVIEAVLEGVLLSPTAPTQQLTLDVDTREARDDLHQEWESAAEREKQSQTKYAQRGIHPEDVARELTEIRAGLGTATDVATFTQHALTALGAQIGPARSPRRGRPGPNRPPRRSDCPVRPRRSPRRQRPHRAASGPPLRRDPHLRGVQPDDAAAGAVPVPPHPARP
jgi:superfamily II DNA or RNA helicase